jgi:hypothetical protein
MPVFAPTVPLGRIEFDAAHRVLEPCSPLRQRQALPYLLALYALINWWENYASWGVSPPSTTNDQGDTWLEEDDPLSWQMELSTTWCERSEIQEQINIADLTVQGVTLGIYPADVQNHLCIHGPTLLGVIKADLCVGVKLDLQRQKATMLGFLPTADLTQIWQTHPPDSQGIFRLPESSLLPMHLLPAQISHLQAFARGQHLTPHPEVAESAPSTPVLPKSNKNFAEPVIPNVKQVLQQLNSLSSLGLAANESANAPKAGSQFHEPSQGRPQNLPELPQQPQKSADDQLQGLIRAFQAYSEKKKTQQQDSRPRI